MCLRHGKIGTIQCVLNQPAKVWKAHLSRHLMPLLRVIGHDHHNIRRQLWCGKVNILPAFDTAPGLSPDVLTIHHALVAALHWAGALAGCFGATTPERQEVLQHQVQTGHQEQRDGRGE